MTLEPKQNSPCAFLHIENTATIPNTHRTKHYLLRITDSPHHLPAYLLKEQFSSAAQTCRFDWGRVYPQ